jgi:hypothetical protein
MYCALILKLSQMSTAAPPKQSKDVLQEEWYIVPVYTIQNLYKSIPKRTAPVLKAS